VQRFRLPEVFLGLLSISANLAHRSLTVRGEAARATGAARRLRREALAYLSTELTKAKDVTAMVNATFAVKR
jgi:hypothetical protein